MRLLDLVKLINKELEAVLAIGLRVSDLGELRILHEQYLTNVQGDRALSALSEKLKSLLDSQHNERAKTYLSLNSLLHKLSFSLAEFKKSSGGILQELNSSERRETKYNEIKNLRKALMLKSGNRLSLLRESIAMDTFKCPQLLPYFIENASDKYGTVSQLIIDEILPFYGEGACILLIEKLDLNGGKSQLRLLDFLLKYLPGPKKKSLLSLVLRQGANDFKKYILQTQSAEEFEINELEVLLSSRSRELKDLAQELIEKKS